MTFKNFRLTYHLFLWLTGFMIAAILGIFTLNTYHYLQANPEIISYLSRFKQAEDHLKEIKVFAVTWLWSAFYVSIKIVFIMIFRAIFKSLSIWSSWLLFWDNGNEIHPILGRLITTHLRYNRFLSFYQIMHYHHLTQVELGMLYHHEKKLSSFFTKYDPLYDKESS